MGLFSQPHKAKIVQSDAICQSCNGSAWAEIPDHRIPPAILYCTKCWKDGHLMDMMTLAEIALIRWEASGAESGKVLHLQYAPR